MMAGLNSALPSVVAGGVACRVGAGAIVLAFPQLAAFAVEETMAATATLTPQLRNKIPAEPSGPSS